VLKLGAEKTLLTLLQHLGRGSLVGLPAVYGHGRVMVRIGCVGARFYVYG